MYKKTLAFITFLIICFNPLIAATAQASTQSYSWNNLKEWPKKQLQVAANWELNLPLVANPMYMDVYQPLGQTKDQWLIGLKTGFYWMGYTAWPKKEAASSIGQIIEVFSYQGQPKASLETILNKISLATSGVPFVFSFSKVQLGPYSGLLYQATVSADKAAAQSIGFCFFRENLWVNINFCFEGEKQNLLSKEEVQQFLKEFIENTQLSKR